MTLPETDTDTATDNSTEKVTIDMINSVGIGSSKENKY